VVNPRIAKRLLHGPLTRQLGRPQYSGEMRICYGLVFLPQPHSRVITVHELDPRALGAYRSKVMLGRLVGDEQKQANGNSHQEPSSPDRRRRALHRSLPNETESYTAGLASLALPQPDAGALAILSDEDHAGRFEGSAQVF
jgi:hypothetical protein